MSTPEAKVKAWVKAQLKAYGAYFTMAVTTGWGRSGAADFSVCYLGYYISIECKADETCKLTPLQIKHGEAVMTAGGYFLRIDTSSLAHLTNTLDTLKLRGPA